MSDREPIDSLQIEIESSSTNASKSLDTLVSSLKKLDRIGKSNSFLLVKKRLQGIASVRFDTLDAQLRRITKNIKTLEVYKKALKNLEIQTPKIDTTSVSDAVATVTRELESVAEPAINSGEVFGGGKPVKPDWLTDIQEECDEIVSSFEDSSVKVEQAKARLDDVLTAKQADYSGEKAFISGSNFADTLSDKMSKLELQASILKDKMDSLAKADNPDETQWKSLEKQLLSVRLQYQALEQQINKNASAVEELGAKSKKTKGFLGKMFDKFKNVAFYRIVRSLIAQLTRSISTGLENIAKFSEEANTVLSAYKTDFLYIKNSLGASLLPILKSLLPTVTRLTDGFVDISNSIGMISAAIGGQNTFLKAKKYAQDYTDTVENAKKATVGFDELNILGNNSSENDVSQMFEEVDISGWDIAGAVAKLTTLVASVTALILLFKGAKLKETFTTGLSFLKKGYNYLGNMSKWKKGVSAVALLAVEATACYTAFYDLTMGTKTWGEVALELIPICAAVGVAMYAMLGPWGLVLAAVVAVVSALVGFISASEKARRQKLSEIASNAFYNSASEIAVSLNDIATAYENIWAETETLASKATESSKTINESTKVFDSAYNSVEHYLGILQESNRLSNSEASAVTENVKKMVDELENQLNTRMDSILDTFQGLADLAKVNFVDDLTEMKTEFLKFQKLLGNVTAEYEQTINDLINTSTERDLTAEEIEKLNAAVNKLSALNFSSSREQYVFDSLIEQAMAGGIDFKDENTVKSFFDTLATDTQNYLGYLKTAYETSDKNIKDFQKQADILYEQHVIDKGTYDSYSQSFAAAREKLKTLYDENVQSIYDQVNDIVNVVQLSAMSKLKDVVNDTSAWYDNQSGWYRFWHDKQADIYDAVTEARDNEIASISNSIKDFYTAIGKENSAWLQEMANNFTSTLYTGGMGVGGRTLYGSVSGYDENGNPTYKYATPGEDYAQQLLDSYQISANHYKDLTGLSTVWKTYQDAANAGYANIRTKSEFARGNNKDKQKYGTYEAYLEGMYKKYILGLSEYATGGFPEDGLFFANHSELVGKFSNGKTAVANNAQIVEGIKRGVSEAMSESGGNDGGTWVIQIVDTDGNVKGEKIVTAAERKNRRDGKTVISVGG